MLSDGDNEFLGIYDLEVFLVVSMSHGRPVEDFAGVLQVGDPGSGSGTSHLLREGVSQNIFRQGLLPIAVFPEILRSSFPSTHNQSYSFPSFSDASVVGFQDNKKERLGDRKERFPIRKCERLEAMKDKEYRYWQQRPASERIAAVSEITTEMYRLKDPAFHVSRLQRTLVAVQQAQG